MDRTFDTAQRIYLYDGYQERPIWQQEENNSTYYNSKLDKQCVVPLRRSMDEVRKELGLPAK